MLCNQPDWAARGQKVWHFQHSNAWWITVLHNVWSLHLDLKSRLFLWRVYVGGLPLASKLRDRGFTNGKCPRCNKACETARHTFWYCKLVHEWWMQLRSAVLHSTGIMLHRFKFTFNTTAYPAQEHEWLIMHIRYWFMQMIWYTRNEALHAKILHYSVGLPLYRLSIYLSECMLVDPSLAGSAILSCLIERLTSSSCRAL